MAQNPNMIGGGRHSRGEMSGDRRQFEGRKLDTGTLLRRLWKYMGRNRILLVLAAILFAIGATTVLLRRNAIIVFMGVELMLNSTNLLLVTFSRMHGNLSGQVLAFFVMVVAAAEVVVGLAIIVTIFRTRRSASVDDVNLLKS